MFRWAWEPESRLNVKICKKFLNKFLFIWYQFNYPRFKYAGEISIAGLLKLILILILLHLYFKYGNSQVSSVGVNLQETFVPTFVALANIKQNNLTLKALQEKQTW